jgi:hypothetical protein
VICQYTSCPLDATTTIADGTELCDMHVLMLRLLHERARDAQELAADTGEEHHVDQADAAAHVLATYQADIEPAPKPSEDAA